MRIHVANEELELLPEKGFVWHREHLLGVSDLHLGKSESYQSAGVPLPSGLHREDLGRLSDLIHRYSVRRVMILGDWIHSQHSLSPNVMEDFRDFFEVHSHVSWTLILGNHERGTHEILRGLPFHMVEEEIRLGPFLFSHGHKRTVHSLFEIQGHVHPLVRIQQGVLQLKLPCFVLEKNLLTIPAFGSLTGGFLVKPQPNRRIFAVAGQEVFEVRSRRS